MKTVPSLVASSTVGAAATGLIFAHSQDPSQPPPTSNKRNTIEYEERARRSSVPPPRPNTTSAIVTPNRFYPGSAYGSSPWPSSSEERPPTSRKAAQRELRTESVNDQTAQSSLRDASGSSGPSQPSYESRDSSSKRDSWYKRFSTRPLSQAGTGSPRSSVGPDSPSVAFSQVSSAAPILSSGANPSQLPPNKLVKPAPVQRDSDITALSRHPSRPHVPTLRRPATSHQRSATLKQRFKEDEFAAMHRPMTHHITPPSNHNTPPPLSIQPQTPTRLRLHFDARPTRTTKERTLGRKAGGLSRSSIVGNKRILPDNTKRPILVKPYMLSDDVVETTLEYFFDDKDSLYVDTPGYAETPMDGSFPDALAQDNDEVDEEDLQKPPRRSHSMQFNAPIAWIPRSSSLRSNRHPEMTMDVDKRYSSAPVASNPEARENGETPVSSYSAEGKLSRSVLLARRMSTGRRGRNPSLALTRSRAGSRNNSSPLPPLTQVSSLNIDFTSSGLSTASPGVMTPGPLWSAQPEAVPSASGSTQTTFASISSPRLSSNGSKFTGAISERGSTLVGSDNDTRAFWSGEDEDFDFQSDTVFDSVRTGTTSNAQRNAPLDTLFDDSPVASPKTKIAPLHELITLGGFRENGDRIIEEDEDMLTPVKNGLRSRHISSNDINTEAFPSSLKFELPSDDFDRLPLENEDEDEDWTKDEDDSAIHSPLSPPSNSLNSNRVSPALRAALADLTNTGSSDRRTPLSPLRTKHSVFDWSEPSSTDKLDGNSPRPKTAHAKQLADIRGGRAIGRRGPSALHIRSQSVPVVPDLVSQREMSNSATKFGTWGLGAKGVSEDWDNDFEFDSADIDEADEGNKRPDSMVMQVPPAIQASQANVVGHVSQIREICLLVEDLKRLRNLAREKGLLYGPTAPLWVEAEGIIALAIPDDDDDTLSLPSSPVSTRFRRDSLDPKFADWGVDAEDVSLPEQPIEVLDSKGRPTGNVYDGKVIRKGSVFSPEDDIFGNSPIGDKRGSRHGPQTPSSATFPRANNKDSAAIARAVMETMHQHRTTDSPIASSSSEPTAKMPFDTTSLKDLVGRAGALSRSLAEIIRKHDEIMSPTFSSSPKRDTRPAFTRVFTDPLTTSPPRNLPRSQSNNSMLSGSLDSSPSRTIGQRMHMMTVV